MRCCSRPTSQTMRTPWRRSLGKSPVRYEAGGRYRGTGSIGWVWREEIESRARRLITAQSPNPISQLSREIAYFRIQITTSCLERQK